MKIKSILLAFLLIIGFSFILMGSVSADEADELIDKIDEYEEKIQNLQGQAKTLENEISYMDSQIGLTELRIQESEYKISQTQEKIQNLTEDIEDLRIRIEKLENSIDYQTDVLSSRMRERYKSRDSSEIMVLFGSQTFKELIQKTEYLKVMELHDNKLIDEMATTKDAFEVQKKLFVEKKEEEESLKRQLEVEKANLDAYRNTLEYQQQEKEQLLEVTQNNEAKYQELLAEAQRELASLKSFVDSAGGGIIGSNAFGDGDEGWYLSQRDARWANETIGRSNYTIYEVGCLITSVAMVYNRYGYDVTPEDIADDNSRFFSNTAMMLIPWQGPNGKTYNSISVSQIKSELDKDRPVIVGVYAGPYGTHFVVLSEEDDGDYIMYDPYYGPDLNFSDYYSPGSIFQAVVFK